MIDKSTVLQVDNPGIAQLNISISDSSENHNQVLGVLSDEIKELVKLKEDG